MVRLCSSQSERPHDDETLDPKLDFEKNAMIHGLSSASLERMKARGWTTLGAFDFAASSLRGSAGSGDAFWSQVGGVIVNVPHSAEVPDLRRLHDGAWSTTSADTTYKVEKRHDDPPRKVQTVAREDRKSRLQEKLGIDMKVEGEKEPSHALFKKAAETEEKDALHRVPFKVDGPQVAKADASRFVMTRDSRNAASLSALPSC